MKKDQKENEEAIEELASGLRDLHKKKEQMIEDIRSRYSTTRINSIVDRVGADLSGSVEELTSVAISSGEDVFQRRLSEVFRTSLMSNVKTEIQRLNEQIVEDLSNSLTGLTSIFSSYTSDGQWFEKIVSDSKSLLNVGVITLKGIMNIATKGRNLYRITSTVLAITTNVVYPIIEVIIVFLPEILSYFQKRKQEEQIRNQLIGTVIPSM